LKRQGLSSAINMTTSRGYSESNLILS